MFTKSIRLYDVLYSFKDYAGAAERLNRLIQERRPGARTLLDVGCGTGKHLEELRNDYEVEGVDINPEILEVARARCPGVRFHVADMAELNLGRKFDLVTCLFSSIGYVKTLDRMERAVAAMARHLAPGGWLFVEPWLTPESYWKGRITANFVDEPELKIAWMYTSEREGPLSRFHIHYLVGRPQGVEYFTEIHEMGLFTVEEYSQALHKAGLAEIVHEAQGLFGRGMFMGTNNEIEP